MTTEFDAGRIVRAAEAIEQAVRNLEGHLFEHRQYMEGWLVRLAESTSEGAQKVREKEVGAVGVPAIGEAGRSAERGMQGTASPAHAGSNPDTAPTPHRDSTAVGEPLCWCCHSKLVRGECDNAGCSRFGHAPTPEPATATVPYEPGPTEQLRRGFDEEGPHDLLCDCPPCCAYHAATQKPEPATVTGSGEAKCDRCFNRYPVLFSMCRPCMDEVAPPSIQPPGDGLTFADFGHANRERCESPAGFDRHLDTTSIDAWGLAICGEAGEIADTLYAIGHNPKKGLTLADVLDEVADVVSYCDLMAQRLGSTLEACLIAKWNRVSEKRGYPERLAATPDGGAAKGRDEHHP